MPIPLPWAGLNLPVTCPDSSDYSREALNHRGSRRRRHRLAQGPSLGPLTNIEFIGGSLNTDNATLGSAKRAIMGGFRAARELPFSLTGLPNGPASAQMPGLPVL